MHDGITMTNGEPLIWSQRTDSLPEEHPWAWMTLYCSSCGSMVHGTPNENMDTWVEVDDDNGPFVLCLKDFLYYEGVTG